jgi:transcriptional regulator with XRE-family HTH domain
VEQDGRLQRLGAFLRERRRTLTPADVGIAETGRRHVKGLRREEVAERAGIGVSWYTLLEQGRARGVTERTLNQIATALHLTPLERMHLLALARAPDVHAASLPLPPALAEYVENASYGISFLMTPAGNIVAWNDEAEAIFKFGSCEPEARNLVVGLIRGGPFREALPDWRHVLDNMIAVMHANYATSNDPAFDALVEQLARESAQFETSWKRQRVESIPLHVCVVRHPHLGTIPMQLFAFTPTLSPHHTLIVLVTAVASTAEGDSGNRTI